MTPKVSTQKIFNEAVEEMEMAIEYGERILPVLTAVMVEKEKQFKSALEVLNKATSQIDVSKVEFGLESADTARYYLRLKSYMDVVRVAFDDYARATTDVYSTANHQGSLREKLALFLANKNTPEMVLPASMVGSNVSSLLDKVLSKKDFGGN